MKRRVSGKKLSEFEREGVGVIEGEGVEELLLGGVTSFDWRSDVAVCWRLKPWRMELFRLASRLRLEGDDDDDDDAAIVEKASEEKCEVEGIEEEEEDRRVQLVVFVAAIVVLNITDPIYLKLLTKHHQHCDGVNTVICEF
ncbi:hypothetical protein RIF29_13849 [Crotalaria pallida]|uniref:Uncharacterized protein n=1 Tax=Crotalaria pallida TaxID=3830 RepID=A0AAN9FCA5_CROPI